MDVLIVADGHYYKDKQNFVYTESTYNYDFYKRYLSVFDNVYAVIRVENVDSVSYKKMVCSGPGVHFLELPNYRGPWQYFFNFFKIRKIMKEYCVFGDCAIFRLPAATSNLFSKLYLKTRKPFAVEVVVDPWEFFKPNTVKSVLRPWIRLTWTNLLKKMCLLANGVSYVTQNYLQSKYPINIHKNPPPFTGSYSSVELPDSCFSQPRTYQTKKTWVLSHSTNTFSSYSKGHLPLIRVLKILVDRDYDVRVIFVGDGPLRKVFEKEAASLGVLKNIEFVGKKPSSTEVRKTIANSDVFVFPTMAEGLPRGLLEAMAEGLPCLSSPTCGVPEVLPNNCLFDYSDIYGFANRLEHLFNNCDELTKLSHDNIIMSRKFSSSNLSKKRASFYSKLKNFTLEKEKSKKC